MATKNEVKKEDDILSQIKEVERIKKQVLLMRSIKQLRIIAKKVLSAKKEMDYLLEELFLSKEDKKRVIDFINSQEDVQLNKSEKKNIKDQVKKELEGEKKKIEEQEEKQWVNLKSYKGYPGVPGYNGYNNYTVPQSTINTYYTTTTSGISDATMRNASLMALDQGNSVLKMNGKELSLKI